MTLTAQIALFLAAAVALVPLFRLSGLGAVLGYMTAGVLIGPWGLGLVSQVDSILHFAELGVVLLLFIIGLELQPSRLWVLRRSVFGLGGAQVLLTGALLAGAALVFGLTVQSAIVAGFGLALSSTAFVLQMLAEKKELTTRYGRDGFAVLLFQDLAVIPFLAILPLLGVAAVKSSEPGWLGALRVTGVVGGVIIGGRLLLRPALRLIARSGNPEVFTAATLLVALGTAILMEHAGLSMSLGAFLAGVLLADSEYRHELEANIEPFKGLLLGLFFIAVGMSTNLGLLGTDFLLIVGLITGLVAVKFAVLYLIGRITKAGDNQARRLGIALAQGGEFAFVLFNLAVQQKVMNQPLADLLVIVVTLSMVATPLLVLVHERWLAPKLDRKPKREFDTIAPEHATPVIIAGFGRFGQIVGRVLRLKKIGFTALEVSADQVDFVRRFGNKVFYGDASRLDLLRAARADEAKVFVLAIDNIEASLKTAQMVREHFPDLKIYARARNRFHAYRLMDLGVTALQRETFLDSLELAGQVLTGLGLSDARRDRTLALFRANDESLLQRQHAVSHDEQQMIQATKDAMRELESLFESDSSAVDKEDNA
ncbi:monovalent cation:proton antiporter-2 (CPA2) family protein [Jeongeupia naejangsanensis]|uniref:Cation:proton antiporter n=1 Tax=Jeongeupia naejangsanensis TaxID=613195 RepID=A0ABS2BK07_9NEIS|nr:monovalent cation:proton antiporter-2 (CPA2) family protein [Jeongeupia naejangsanensis]MBM3115326.1 cation:proton antiporter [Jeongeupia naejangsanensis]